MATSDEPEQRHRHPMVPSDLEGVKERADLTQEDLAGVL